MKSLDELISELTERAAICREAAELEYRNYSHSCELDDDCASTAEDDAEYLEDIVSYLEQLQSLNDNRSVIQWVVDPNNLPEEHTSMFAKYYGTPNWDAAMFRSLSDDVLTIRLVNNAAIVARIEHTIDGQWKPDNASLMPSEVIAWADMSSIKDEFVDKYVKHISREEG